MNQDERGSLPLLQAALLAGRTDVRLLVPTATLAEHRRHQLARAGLVFRPDCVQTFSRFTADLVPDVKQVSEPLFQLVVERALGEVAPLEFQPVSDAPGFAASVAEAIRRLDATGLTERELGGLCAGWPYAGPLARVWARVEAKLAARGVTLRAGLLRAATANATRGGTLLLDGFARFTALERGLLDRLGVAEETSGGLPGEIRQGAVAERFFSASEVRECEEIARRIVELERKGISFRTIGIAVRNPDRYVSLLRPVLERFGIPARFYFSEPLAENPVARFFAGTIEANLGGWNHERLLGLLRLAPRFPPEDMDAFDFAVRKNIPAADLNELLKLGATGPVAWLIQDWELCDRNWQRRLVPGRWAELLSADFRTLYRPLPIGDGAEAGTVDWERARAAALSLFEAALAEAAADWPEQSGPVSLAQFWERARVVVQHTSLRAADRRRNVVHVMSVFEARQWELDTVFLCGLADKQFPRRHQEDAFLPDEAMRKLQAAGFGVETSDDRDAGEAALFEMVRDSARRQVVLSYAVEGKNGPSLFWGSSDGALDAVAPVRPAERAQVPARPRVVRIESPALLEWIRREKPDYSVTGLENFLGCPYKFFELNLLGAKAAPARPEKRLSFLEEGNIVHKVLEVWLAERPPMAPVFDRIFAEQCAQLRVRPGFRTEKSYAAMLANLERFAGDSTGWPRHEALYTEKDMPFPIAEGVMVKARVDRVERLADGRLVVIDYKYSNAKNTKNRTEDETRLQGPLYVKGNAVGGETVAAMVYFSLKDSAEPFGWGEVPGLQKQLQPLTPEWVQRGVDEALVAVSKIRDGWIPVRQAVGPPCTWCDAKDACRVPLSGFKGD